MEKAVRKLLTTLILAIVGITLNAQPTLVTEVPKNSTNFVEAGDLVFFTSNDSLLRTDGTSEGTIFLKSGFSRNPSQQTDFNGMLFFVVGDQLWRSDGTPGGTILLTTKNGLEILKGVGTTLFFRASDAATGIELYKTDGSSAGTNIVKDLNPGAGNGFLGNSAVIGNNLFFRGDNGVNGTELWKSNGTTGGTLLVKDINSGNGDGFMGGGVYVFNDILYFTGNTTTNGKEPWVSDGTEAGTVMLKDIEPGAEEITWILWGIDNGGALYFIVKPKWYSTDDKRNTAQLWKTSGTTASTVSLGTLTPDWVSDVTYHENPFRVYKDKVVFFSTSMGGNHKMWVSDGTPSGTQNIFSVNDVNGQPKLLFFDVVQDYILFSAADDQYSYGLFRSDGTAAGTQRWLYYKAWYNSQGDGGIRGPIKVGDFLFYADHDGPSDSDAGMPEDPDDYYHLFQNNGESQASMRTLYGVSTLGTHNITDYNSVVAFTTQDTRSGSTDKRKFLWTYDPHTPAGNEEVGKISQEVWDNVTGTKVSTIPVNSEPSSVKDLTIFETATNVADNYGSRVRGYVMVPETGNYTFWIASDDQSQLWLSTDDDPANKKKIAEVTGWTTSRQWERYPSQKSAAISLVANRKYYIEALHKEGTGGDNLAVGWQLPNGSMERPIPGNRLISFSSIANSAPKVTITEPEDGATFNAPAIFAISADAFDQEGNLQKVEFYNGTAKLGEDTSSPYRFVWQDVPAGNYDVIAKAIDDDGGTDADTVNITVLGGDACAGAGMIRQEFWTGVSGTRVSDIPVNEEPEFTQELTIFEGPVSAVGDNYGSRIRGYICPPASGQYIFWIAGDDQVELSLSTDDDPANKTRIAYHMGWTNKREWTKYTTQQSAPITLQAGQRYYIEALMKEGAKADHVSVGWQQPDGTMERPIAGSHLIPFGASDPDPDPTCAGTGTISVETWTGIDGVHVSSIPLDSEPNLSGERDIFEAPTNIGSNFGSRFRGYLCAPTTGDYTFWIASDDHSELWLSTDADPANKVRIAYHTGWTSPRQWTKYATQQSAPIALVAGQQYYIEALYKEDEGGDNMAVGWQLPDGTMERPIPGNRLSPFEEAEAMMATQSISSEEQLYEQISVYPNPATSGHPELRVAGYEGIEQTVETEVQIMSMTGEVVLKERIECGGNCGTYLMNINKQLVPGVYVVNMKTNGVRTSKRLLVK